MQLNAIHYNHFFNQINSFLFTLLIIVSLVSLENSLIYKIQKL